jgi:hypothetical protein
VFFATPKRKEHLKRKQKILLPSRKLTEENRKCVCSDAEERREDIPTPEF